MGKATPGRRFEDYLELLRAFDDSDAQALIVGGQAVNFWAEAFEELIWDWLGAALGATPNQNEQYKAQQNRKHLQSKPH
jgi:hypothetical protein